MGRVSDEDLERLRKLTMEETAKAIMIPRPCLEWFEGYEKARAEAEKPPLFLSVI